MHYLARTHKFYKTIDERWYIDLPDYDGKKADLEMVLGADVMLNIMAGNNDIVYLYISEVFFDNCSELIFQQVNKFIGSGADYILKSFQGIDMNINVWLCDVVLFIFGKFPKNIYVALEE